MITVRGGAKDMLDKVKRFKTAQEVHSKRVRNIIVSIVITNNSTSLFLNQWMTAVDVAFKTFLKINAFFILLVLPVLLVLRYDCGN